MEEYPQLLLTLTFVVHAWLVVKLGVQRPPRAQLLDAALLPVGLGELQVDQVNCLEEVVMAA